MRAVIQRVLRASVKSDGEITSEIGPGLLILLGVEDSDSLEDIEWLTKKIINLRIFNDTKGCMNLSLLETGGEIMIVSQFTLMAQTKKGNRPSYIRASKPETAKPLYEQFCTNIFKMTRNKPKTGIFGADMKVSLVNDGPVTIIIDTKNKE